jgi:stage V sporulation protein B
MLITISSLISRLLGALYRPIAQLFLGDYGLALVTPPSAAYMIIMAVSSVGLNVAISRLVSERLAVQDYLGARRILHVATWLLVISGTLFGALFALAAPWLARVQGFPEAAPGFVALAPAIFLVSLLCAFRGLYQGMQYMYPSAVSQVVEQAGRVGLGLAAVAFVSPIAINYGAAAFNAGNTIGILLAVLYGGWVYFRQRPTETWTTAEGPYSVAGDSIASLLRKILSIALPLSLVGAILPLTQQIDSMIVTNRLLAIGVEAGAAKEALAYLMNAGTLRDLPAILTIALYVSLVPAVSQSMATGQREQALYRTTLALRLTFLVGTPATIGLIIGAKEAYEVFFTGPGYLVMVPLAGSTLLLMVQQILSGTLQGMGLIWTSVRSLLVGILVKTVLTYWWTGLPGLQAKGAAYATTLAFGVVVGLNLWALHRSLGFGLRLREQALRPLAAALLMGAAIWLASPTVHQWVQQPRLAGLVTIGLGSLIYLIAIFAVGGVTTADLRMVPGISPALVERLSRFRVLGRREGGDGK